MSEVLQVRPRQAPGIHVLDPATFNAAEPGFRCDTCSHRKVCLAGGVPAADLERVETIVSLRRHVRRGERLFRVGDPFHSLYAIRSGFFKTTLVDPEGREQVTGFFMGGELLGMEGLGSGRCENSAIALEDSVVCTLPYGLIQKVARGVPSLQRQLHLVLAREISRGQGIMMLLGSMSAAERLAAFIMGLSARLLSRGYSGSRFVLRMSREEIGSYLGLTVETVSRLITGFRRKGLLDVEGKRIAIVDLKGLDRVRTSREPGQGFRT